MKKIGQTKQYTNPERQALSENKEKLRTAKKEWNKHVKDFISELIEIKQLVNGRPKEGERIKLYEPMPKDLDTKLSNVERHLSEKINQARAIENFQNNYSAQYNKFYGELESKRQLRKGKQASEDYNLISEGIHPLSVKWHSLKSIFAPTGSEESVRSTMLKQLWNLDQKFSMIEMNLLKVKAESELDTISTALYQTGNALASMYEIAERKAKALEEPSDGYAIADKAPATATPSARSSSKSGLFDTNVTSQLQKIYTDLTQYFQLLQNLPVKPTYIQDPNLLKKIESVKSKVIMALHTTKRMEDASKAIDEYNHLLRELSIESFYSEWERKKLASEYYEDLILKEAKVYDSIFSKTQKGLGKFKLKLRIFSNIRANLESMYGEIRQIREMLDTLMEELKISLDYKAISQTLYEARKINKSVSDECRNLKDIVDGGQVTPKEMQQINSQIRKKTFKQWLFGTGGKEKDSSPTSTNIKLPEVPRRDM